MQIILAQLQLKQKEHRTAWIGYNDRDMCASGQMEAAEAEYVSTISKRCSKM
jgi:hypothetical protein